jgi:predicted ATPase/DNA-binding XRE family transcriptional regulator
VVLLPDVPELVEAAPFGDLLKRYRVATGVSQELLAERAHVSPAAIGALERGVRRAPYRETVALLAEALGLSRGERAEFEASAQRARRRGSRSADAAAPAARDNLATRLTSFVGRADEFVELAGLLGRYRVVTVTGPGGVGKTSIAVELARRFLAAGRPEAWFVDLSPLGEGTFVAGAIAAVVGLPLPEFADPLPALAASLAARDLLLVLDNCEHVVAAAAAAASAIVRGCPRIAVLATSRERLAIEGECVYRLPALPVPAPTRGEADDASSFAAVQLFIDRASAADSRLAFPPEQLATVAGICRQLEGIPLAIELAASRLPALGFEALDKRLKEQFVIASASRDRPRRHQTMFATIAWSYDLLSEDEQTLVRRLAPFCAGAPFEAVEAVCAGEAFAARISELLGTLVDKSLLTCTFTRDECRYVMLDSVRAFATRQSVESGVFAPIARAHAQWLAAVAEYGERRYLDVPPHRWIAEFGPELDNARAALEWALASEGPDDVALAGRILGGLRRLWIAPQRRIECRRWAVAILARLDVRAHPPVAAVVMRAYLQSIDGSAVLDAADEAIALFTQLGDRRGLVSLHAHVAWEYGLRGAFAEAERAIARAFELAEAETMQRSRHFVRLLEARCLVRALAGRLPEARSDATAAVALRQAIGATDVKLEFYWNAYFAFADGNIARAAELLDVCVDAARAQGESRAGPLSELAAAHLMLGDLDAAASAVVQSLELFPFERIESAWRAIQHTAAIAAQRGEPRRAARLLGFVDAWCAERGGFRGYHERASYAILTDSLRAQLKPETITALAAGGALLDVERALTEARTPGELRLTSSQS